MEFGIRAYLALLLFIPVSVTAMVASRRPMAAIVGVYLGGLLFLPELVAFDFPLLPPMDKNGFAAAMAFIGAVLLQRHKLRKTRPFRGVDLFFLVMVAGNIGTAVTNPDFLSFGNDYFRPHDGEQVGFRITLQGLTMYDALSMTVRDLISTFLPFYVGRALFRTREDARLLFKALVVFCLVYVPLMLIEMRLSPQLHNWIYGYQPNLFFHAVRGGGFKPNVFLNNGLAVAMLMLSGTIGAAALFKVRKPILGIPGVIPLGLLWVMLALSRNVGATLYSLAAVPTVVLSRGKLAMRMSLILFGLVLAYPALRATKTLPVYDMVEFVSKYSEERAQSINTRFTNEDQLFDRARERLWFGWGGFGRNRIYDDWGRDASITDGEWIIRFGSRGLVGFVGSFGLLLWPILIARRRWRALPTSEDRTLIDAMTLIVALHAVDLLPNGLFTEMPYFLAGALAGLAQGMSSPSTPSTTVR